MKIEGKKAELGAKNSGWRAGGKEKKRVVWGNEGTQEENKREPVSLWALFIVLLVCYVP